MSEHDAMASMEAAPQPVTLPQPAGITSILRCLSDDEMAAIRSRIIAGGTDFDNNGVTMEEIRNAVYTKALRVNPNVEAEDAEAKANKRSAKKGTGESTRTPTLKGEDMNDLLG